MKKGHGELSSHPKGFLSIIALIVLSVFLLFGTLLEQRAETLFSLTAAEDKINVYIKLLSYIKKQCMIQNHNERLQEEDLTVRWMILDGTNCYRIYLEDNVYLVYQGMRIILKAYTEDEALIAVKVGSFEA